MSLTDMVIMPGADYQDACEAIREKTGGIGYIRSGEMGGLIRGISTGVELPELTNPASAGDIASGKEAVDGEGNKIVGTIYTIENGSILTSLNEATIALFNSRYGYMAVDIKAQNDYILRAGGAIRGAIVTEEFGDATAEDVAAGKTFTSADGLKVTGTAARGGNLQYFTLPIGRSLGDVNGDGRINFDDYFLISDHVTNIEPITDEVALWCADVDGSGSIGVNDMTSLNQYLVGDLSVSNADYYGNWTYDSTNEYYFVDIPAEGVTTESKVTLLVPAHANAFAAVICMNGTVRICAAVCPGEEMECCLFMDEDGRVLDSAPPPEVEQLQTSVTINSTNYDQRVRMVYVDEAGERKILTVSAGTKSEAVMLPTPSMIAMRFAPNMDEPEYNTSGGFVDYYDGFTRDTTSGPECVTLFFVRGDVEFVFGEEE